MESFFKPVRVADRNLLDAVKNMPCLCCHRPPPSDPDHVTSRGAGGDDSESNVWPLCRKHHTERHSKGIVYMVDTYPRLKDWLHKMKRWDVLNMIENKRMK